MISVPKQKTNNTHPIKLFKAPQRSATRTGAALILSLLEGRLILLQCHQEPTFQLATVTAQSELESPVESTKRRVSSGCSDFISSAVTRLLQNSHGRISSPAVPLKAEAKIEYPPAQADERGTRLS